MSPFTPCFPEIVRKALRAGEIVQQVVAVAAFQDIGNYRPGEQGIDGFLGRMQLVSHAKGLLEKLPHRESAGILQHLHQRRKQAVADPAEILRDFGRILAPAAESSPESAFRGEKTGNTAGFAVLYYQKWNGFGDDAISGAVRGIVVSRLYLHFPGFDETQGLLFSPGPSFEKACRYHAAPVPGAHPVELDRGACMQDRFVRKAEKFPGRFHIYPIRIAFPA